VTHECISQSAYSPERLILSREPELIWTGGAMECERDSQKSTASATTHPTTALFIQQLNILHTVA